MSTLVPALFAFFGGWCVSAALDASLPRRVLLATGIVLIAASFNGTAP